MIDVMFAAHTDRLEQLRAEADHERVLRSAERATAGGKGSARKLWRAFANAPRRTARPA